MTMWSQNSKDQMEFNKLALQANQQQHNQQIEQLKVDKGFAWTRRFIALSIVLGALAMVFAPALFDVPQLVELTSSSDGLFGLFKDTTTTFIETYAFSIPEWWSSAFTAVVGLYFGNSIVKK